jgi:hypothetical protein
MVYLLAFSDSPADSADGTPIQCIFLTVAIRNCMVQLYPLLTFVLMKIFKPFLEQSWKIY